MSPKKQKSSSKKNNIPISAFFKRYLTLPYILKWLFISSLVGIFVGSASAGFLQSLDWVTNYRESHLQLISFLPIAGFVIRLLYYHLGKDIEAGNNLLIGADFILVGMIILIWK